MATLRIATCRRGRTRSGPFAVAVLGEAAGGTLAADLKAGMEMDFATMPRFTDDDGAKVGVTHNEGLFGCGLSVIDAR